MEKERRILSKFIIEAMLKETSLEVTIQKLEEKKFDFYNLHEHITEYAEAKGRLKEVRDQLATYRRALEELDKGRVPVFEYEVPF